MNRRGFFGIFAGGSAVTATLVRQQPPKFRANVLSETGKVQVPIHIHPEHLAGVDLRDFDVHEELRKLTRRFHNRLENALNPRLQGLCVNTTMELAQAGDTVNVGSFLSDGTWRQLAQVQLNYHLEATALVPEVYGLMKNPGILDQMLDTCRLALQHRIIELTKGRKWIVFRAVPNILPGLGVVSARAIGTKVMLRSILRYDPDSLSQAVTFDVLFGVA